MVMKSKKIKYLLIVFLTLLELSSLFLAWKSLSHKVTIIDDVRFKEENEKEKKTIAIMLNEGDGSYKESASTTFPKEGYIYNTQKSGCIDTTGKEVVNTINYESGKVSLRLNQKLYCYLYFDKKEKPIIDKFYINDETSNKTTKVPEVTIHLKWSDPYIKEYCISETQDIDSCTWQTSNGVTEIISNYTFTTEGKKTMYSYIKDIAEGVSEVKSDSIEYKKPPTAGDIGTNPPPETSDGGGAITKVAQDELKMRYYGTNPPNYICFGTTNKSTCTSSTGQKKYMYRVIGVDKSNRFKLIKKTPIEQNNNKRFYWHNSHRVDIKWNQSDLYKGLNGIGGGKYTNLFIGNSTYMPSGWADKIETVNWKYGDVYASNAITAVNITATQMVQKEQAWSTTVSAKIGLMYLADYYFSNQKSGLNCSILGEYQQCKRSWMHISQNDTETTDNDAFDWTMSRYGKDSYFDAWYVFQDGHVGNNYLIIEIAVRPVFYLKSNVEIMGTGTQSDPYIIVN